MEFNVSARIIFAQYDCQTEIHFIEFVDTWMNVCRRIVCSASNRLPKNSWNSIECSNSICWRIKCNVITFDLQEEKKFSVVFSIRHRIGSILRPSYGKISILTKLFWNKFAIISLRRKFYSIFECTFAYFEPNMQITKIIFIKAKRKITISNSSFEKCQISNENRLNWNSKTLQSQITY